MGNFVHSFTDESSDETLENGGASIHFTFLEMVQWLGKPPAIPEVPGSNPG